MALVNGPWSTVNANRALTGSVGRVLGRIWVGLGRLGRAGLDIVTPSVLRPKQTTKSCHEHRVYVIIYVMECVDNIFVTSDDQ